MVGWPSGLCFPFTQQNILFGGQMASCASLLLIKPSLTGDHLVVMLAYVFRENKILRVGD